MLVVLVGTVVPAHSGGMVYQRNRRKQRIQSHVLTVHWFNNANRGARRICEVCDKS